MSGESVVEPFAAVLFIGDRHAWEWAVQAGSSLEQQLHVLGNLVEHRQAVADWFSITVECLDGYVSAWDSPAGSLGERAQSLIDHITEDPGLLRACQHECQVELAELGGKKPVWT